MHVHKSKIPSSIDQQTLNNYEHMDCERLLGPFRAQNGSQGRFREETRPEQVAKSNYEIRELLPITNHRTTTISLLIMFQITILQ